MLKTWAVVLSCCWATSFAAGQESTVPTTAPTCPRILVQDAQLNNLVDPQDYQTAPLGTLGAVHRVGEGEQTMILVPGLGFGGKIFDEFMAPLAKDFRMYAVTLPGFAGTAAPPSPGETVSFGEQTWTQGAVAAIEKLMEDEKISDAILVGHWLSGTQIALRLALKHPDRIRGVILLAGAARMSSSDPKQAEQLKSPERRVRAVDEFMAPRWFKTVTRETWDDNNFLPGDYAVHPVRGLRLWREAAQPPLHVWVRYLCEFNAQDIGQELEPLAVPTLLVMPGLEGIPHDQGNHYMAMFCRDSWQGIIENHTRIQVKTMANARACLWFDQPEEVRNVVADFVKELSPVPNR